MIEPDVPADYGPATYGDAFADVYDDWYADISDVEATVVAKQLVRNKSLRKEEEEEAAKAKIAAMGGRDPAAEREAALEALAKQEEAERSRANSPAERPPTVEEAAARLFGNL